MYSRKFKPQYSNLDKEASAEFIDEEAGITFFGDCEFSRFVDEQHAKNNHQLLDYVQALDELGCISIWPATGYASIVRQIKAVRSLSYYNEILNTIKKSWAEIPDFIFVKLEEFTTEKQEYIRSIIKDIHYNNDLLFEISPRLFEHIIAEMLLAENFEIKLTQQTRDNGYDIEATKNISGFDVKIVIECKRNLKKNPVGINVIRGFNDVLLRERANKGILVTTSHFSADAWKRKHEMSHLLDLIDSHGLLNWIDRYCHQMNFIIGD